MRHNILILKCSQLFKQAAGTYIQGAANPVRWTKLFLELGYSGIHDPGLGIIHPNEPEAGVIFGSKFLDVLDIIKNPNKLYHSKEDKKRYKNVSNYLENEFLNINENTPIDKISNLISLGLKYKFYFRLRLLKNIDVNKLPINLLKEFILVNRYDTEISDVIAITSNNVEILEFLYRHYQDSKIDLLEKIKKYNDKLSKLDKEKLFNKLTITSFANDNNWIDKLKQYVNKPYHYIHYSNTPEIFGINTKFEYRNPIGIYGYPLTLNKLNNVKFDIVEFASIREYIVIFKARSPNTVLDFTTYNDTNLKQDVNKLKQLYLNSIDVIDNLYDASKNKATINHPGSRLFYITMMLSSNKNNI